MSNNYFQFKQFTIHQDHCAMKVTTDACLFGAWIAGRVGSQESRVRSPAAAGGLPQAQQESGGGRKRILDIGTGTGLLSLMIAQKSDVVIEAVEIDKPAAGQAAENIAASIWKEKIKIVHGDIKDLSKKFTTQFEVIISNPPFYENELISTSQQKNVAHHRGGLLLHELLEVIKHNLDADGEFYLLLPSKRMIEAGLLIQKYHLAISEAVMVRQSANHSYFRVFIRGKHVGNSEEDYTKSEISVWDSHQQYTPEFTELLKDYYLYL